MLKSLLSYLQRRPVPAQTDLHTYMVRRKGDKLVEVLFQRNDNDALRLGQLLFATKPEEALIVRPRPDWDLYSGWLGIPTSALLGDGWLLPCDHCGKAGAKHAEGFYAFCGRACRSAATEYVLRRQSALAEAERELLRRWKDARIIATNYAIAACRTPKCLGHDRPIVSCFWLAGFTASLFFCHGCNSAIVATCDRKKML